MAAGVVRMGVIAVAVVCVLANDVVATSQLTVPEIDGSLVPAAFGLVTAGVLMLRARRRSK